MTNCIKTGAKVYLSDYDVTLPADVYSVGPSTYIFVFNMAPFNDRSIVIPKEEARYHIKFPQYGYEYFWRKDDGILAIQAHCIKFLEEPANV